MTIVTETIQTKKIVSDVPSEHGKEICKGGWELRQGAVSGRGKFNQFPIRVFHAQSIAKLVGHLLDLHHEIISTELRKRGWVKFS